MSCHFPSKKARKEIFHKKIRSPHCDIKVLKRDSVVVDRYSEALDTALKDATDVQDIDDLNEKITTLIQECSKEIIPENLKPKIINPG